MLSTKSVPHMREPDMADAKTTEEPTETKAEKTDAKAKPEKRKLGRASESGDAGVQNLLGQRSIHASNGNDARVAEIDATLADLGYAV
jgi:hypothetical protein